MPTQTGSLPAARTAISFIGQPLIMIADVADQTNTARLASRSIADLPRTALGDFPKVQTG
jgi:hypothetical protein